MCSELKSHQIQCFGGIAQWRFRRCGLGELSRDVKSAGHKYQGPRSAWNPILKRDLHDGRAALYELLSCDTWASRIQTRSNLDQVQRIVRINILNSDRGMKKQSLGKLLVIVGAGLSFLFSVGLWFSDQREEGLFVGIWVPSILSFGSLLFAGQGAQQ